MKLWQVLLIACLLIALTWFWDAFFISDLFDYFEEEILKFLRIN